MLANNNTDQGCRWPDTKKHYTLVFLNGSKVRTTNDILSIPVIKYRSTWRVWVLKPFDSKQARTQKKKSVLFPTLEETTDATVMLEFIKIRKSNLSYKSMAKLKIEYSVFIKVIIYSRNLDKT